MDSGRLAVHRYYILRVRRLSSFLSHCSTDEHPNRFSSAVSGTRSPTPSAADVAAVRSINNTRVSITLTKDSKSILTCPPISAIFHYNIALFSWTLGVDMQSARSAATLVPS